MSRKAFRIPDVPPSNSRSNGSGAQAREGRFEHGPRPPGHGVAADPRRAPVRIRENSHAFEHAEPDRFQTGSIEGPASGLNIAVDGQHDRRLEWERETTTAVTRIEREQNTAGADSARGEHDA